MGTAHPFSQGPDWHAGTLVGFDLETTGVDTTTDRVVTAAVVHVSPSGQVTRAREWLVDAGVRIPTAAHAVHGVSTEQVRASGRPSSVAIAEIVQELETAWTSGLPVVIFNAPYDLTLLDAEAVRSGLPRLATRPWWSAAWVIDPMVIDRGVDRYRTGKTHPGSDRRALRGGTLECAFGPRRRRSCRLRGQGDGCGLRVDQACRCPDAAQRPARVAPRLVGAHAGLPQVAWPGRRRGRQGVAVAGSRYRPPSRAGVVGGADRLGRLRQVGHQLRA